MSLLQLVRIGVGQVGVLPGQVSMVSTASLATITTAGYLSNNVTSAAAIISLSPSDIINCLYSFNPVTGSGSYVQLQPSVTFTDGASVITLVAVVSPGNVTLPVVSGNLASFDGTTGLIQDSGVSSTLPVFLGNVQAGKSGTAGDFISYPAAASKGSFIFKAVANTGNTTTTVSNDAMGQASVVSIPDPANAIGQFMVGATATPFVSGNIPQASGTAGLFTDSGVTATSISGAITQVGTVSQVSVTLTPAQMVTAYDAPLTLIAAPGATKMIQIISAAVYTASTGHTAYATGTAPIIQYGTTAHGAGTIAVGAGLVAGDITAATSQVRILGPAASAALTGTSNLPVTFSNATGDYTGGTGTNVVITLVYQVLTATV